MTIEVPEVVQTYLDGIESEINDVLDEYNDKWGVHVRWDTVPSSILWNVIRTGDVGYLKKIL